MSPISSSSTSERPSASRERRSRFVMCAEKVESAASIDCASPMSARNAVNTGKLALVAGTGIPACAIIASSAVVLRATVLPPVFGPLMISWRSFEVSSKTRGTACPPLARRRFSSSGWRAPSRNSRSGRIQERRSNSRAKRARANRLSTKASTRAPSTKLSA